MNIVNNDDEHGYDVTTASQFTIMLYDLGFTSTIAPYTYNSFWNSLVSSVNQARPGAIERNYVQCYDGGAYNNPCDWKIGDVPVWAGKLNYDDKNSVNSIMTGWRDNCDVKGGFIWVFNDTGMSPSSWTSVINPIFEGTGIKSYISVNNEESVNTTYIKVLEGESVSLEPEYKEGNWSWKGPDGFTSNSNMVTLSDITIESGGNYIVKYVDPDGVDYTKNILVQVEKNTENSVASFYDNWDYYGSYEISLALGEYDSESLNTLGIGANNITSVKVEPGYGVVVYSEDNFLGDYTCITGDMSYLDNWNKRINSLKIIELPSGTGTGLKADYYSGNNFNVLKGSRIDESVNFDWGTGAPLAGMPVDNFSIRWSGKIEPLFTGTYTFYITSDNSRRLWINNQLIIDKWINDWDIEYSGSIDLEAGKKYDIKLDYCEYEGGANIKFHWSSDMQMKEIVPTKQLYPEDQINGLGDMMHTNSDLKVWPTVVNDGILNVRFENEAKLSGCNYSIININGSLVDSGEITQNRQITLKTLTAGMYIIQITNAEKRYIHKIIIK
ncbi:PA14 domain-containing protein [Carboxylicivirga caseinilyticus]|uniref:PA14 domain-containing protein n=1 Tax=Carboxylicivirga caseinilyticus TaxID=3417572 RepID=UPI003D32CB9F|nr:T9SS type A sorting domain-containing protein [Marinilabiliaceae bacterium A049]